jgi:DNA-binding cell septation regulator SpoVG
MEVHKMSVQVLQLKRLTTPGNLKAFVKLSVEGMIFHDFRIVQQPGQAAWVSPPQAEWADKAGKKHYKPLIELPEMLKNEVSEAVLNAWSN